MRACVRACVRACKLAPDSTVGSRQNQSEHSRQHPQLIPATREAKRSGHACKGTARRVGTTAIGAPGKVFAAGRSTTLVIICAAANMLGGGREREIYSRTFFVCPRKFAMTDVAAVAPIVAHGSHRAARQGATTLRAVFIVATAAALVLAVAQVRGTVRSTVLEQARVDRSAGAFGHYVSNGKIHYFQSNLPASAYYNPSTAAATGSEDYRTIGVSGLGIAGGGDPYKYIRTGHYAKILHREDEVMGKWHINGTASRDLAAMRAAQHRLQQLAASPTPDQKRDSKDKALVALLSAPVSKQDAQHARVILKGPTGTQVREDLNNYIKHEVDALSSAEASKLEGLSNTELAELKSTIVSHAQEQSLPVTVTPRKEDVDEQGVNVLAPKPGAPPLTVQQEIAAERARDEALLKKDATLTKHVAKKALVASKEVSKATSPAQTVAAKAQGPEKEISQHKVKTFGIESKEASQNQENAPQGLEKAMALAPTPDVPREAVKARAATKTVVSAPTAVAAAPKAVAAAKTLTSQQIAAKVKSLAQFEDTMFGHTHKSPDAKATAASVAESDSDKAAREWNPEMALTREARTDATDSDANARSWTPPAVSNSVHQLAAGQLQQLAGIKVRKAADVDSEGGEKTVRKMDSKAAHVGAPGSVPEPFARENEKEYGDKWVSLQRQLADDQEEGAAGAKKAEEMVQDADGANSGGFAEIEAARRKANVAMAAEAKEKKERETAREQEASADIYNGNHQDMQNRAATGVLAKSTDNAFWDDAEAKRLAQSQVTQQRKTSYRTTPAMADPYQYIRSGNYAKILAKEPGPAVASMMMPRQQHKVSDGLRAVGHAKTMTERQSAEPQTHALEGLNGYRTTPAMADPYKYIRSGNYAKILSKFGSANPITGWKPTIQNSKQVSLRALAQMLAAKPMRNAAAEAV